MQILSIKLKNIKAHRDTELNFSAGINVLSGPNGVGKSTIFEAIGYALFGVDAQSFVGNVERFISIGAKKGEIEVIFQLTCGESYRVSRTVGTPSRWLLAKQVGGDFEVEEHKDSKETEVRLKQLLGLDNGRSLSEQFELVIGPFQHEFLGPFVIKQPTKRRDRFDEILGIDTWRKTFAETNPLLKTINGKVEVLQAEIGSRQEQVQPLPEKQLELKTTTRELGQAQEEFEQQQSELAQLESRLADLDRREQTIRQLQSAIATHRERIGNGEEKIAGQKLLISEAEQAQQVLSETAAGRAAFEKTETRLAELYGQVKQQRRLEGEVAELDKQVTALGERFEAESRSIEQAREEIGREEQRLAAGKAALVVDEQLQGLAGSLPELRAAIDRLRQQQGQLDGRRSGLEEGGEKLAEGMCPFFKETCLNIADKPPQDVFSSKLAELEQERQRLGDEIAKLAQKERAASEAEGRLKEVQIERQGLEQQTERLAERRKTCDERAAGLKELQDQQTAALKQLTEKQQALEVYSRLQTDIEAAEQEKRTHQQARDLHVANQRQAAELEQRQVELQKFEQFLNKLQGELAEQQAELKQAAEAYAAEQHSQIRQQKDQLRETVGTLRQKLVDLNGTVRRLGAEIERLQEIAREVEAKREQVKAYGEKEGLVKFLRNKVFRNVSGYLSERFREEISLRADKIYRTIAEVDEELCWGENYQIVLRDMAEGQIRERVDDQLSGGQTMSAVVALRLALLQTIGARIAFFDEPTSNLDATRRENLAHAFRAIDVGKEELTEHWYDQLFLISHDVAFTEVTDQIVALDDLI